MKVKIKTLTPLWTGGVETGKCDRIHETGILGSLRWWMEALVRGMGGQVKDQTAEKPEDRSSLDTKKFDTKRYRELQDEVERREYLHDAGLCDVSQIFGATGWKRQFRLEVVEDKTQPDNTVTPKIQAERSNNESGKPPAWYFPEDLQDKPKLGEFTIKIQSLSPNFQPEIIAGLIQFMADWSALGARPQMGFGVIEVEGDRIDTQPLYDWLITTAGSNAYSDLPSLQNIFLAQIQPKDSNSSFEEEDTFNLKHDLRQLFRAATEANKGKDGDRDLRHFIMGTVGSDRMAAKIKVSRAYNGGKLMRVWGWIPEASNVYKNGWDRKKVIDDIHKHLEKNYTLHYWREMNSARDTKTPNISDAKMFLCNLLQSQEEVHNAI